MQYETGIGSLVRWYDITMSIDNKHSNNTVIEEWSTFSEDDIKIFGDDGDSARKNLLDPAVFTLAGDLKDKNILDAGCGNGYLSRKLAKAGASVTGIEPSESLYQHCVKLETMQPQGIKYRQLDLADLDVDQVYDKAFLINVLMDIPEYEVALRNVVHSLKPGGELILSILHPCFPGFEDDWKKLGYVKVEEYFNAPPLKQKYGYLFNRSLQDYINGIIQGGCNITQIIEPQLNDGSDTRNTHVPQFLIIKSERTRTLN